MPPSETSAVERALGAIGTTFRLTRMYPSTHPAAQESLRQLAATLPALAELGTTEWKVGATGLHSQHEHVLPRNSQLAELAGLLFSRGVRAVTFHPGVTAEHVLALFGVATGGTPLEDPALGHVGLTVARRSGARRSAATRAPPLVAPAARAPEPVWEGKRVSVEFRPDVLPADVEAKRAVAALQGADTADARMAAADRLIAIAPQLVAQRDTATIAAVIVALDELLPAVAEPAVAERIGAAGAALADGAMVQHLVRRLGEHRVPPGEREALVKAVGALASVAAGLLVDAYLAAPAELREPFRAAVRAAADRALEPLQGRLEEKQDDVVAAAVHLLGLTGSPQAVPILVPLIRHRAEAVREAALHAMAEIGGREVSRPAMPALKDASAMVRSAAARAIGLGGDAGATTVLVRRLDQEEDEGVLAELLKAIGRLGAAEALEVLARHAEPGGRPRRRTPHVRAAAIEGLGYLQKPEARGLLELYSQDKEPTVRRAAEAVLR
jgi:HEAT repeat protein